MRRYLPALLAAVLLASLVAAPTVQPAAGFSNGHATAADLAPIKGSNPSFVYLAHDGAAASWNTMRICSNRAGVDLYTGGDGAYRSIAQQVARWQQYQNGTGNLAAYPGTSNHGLGHAIDNDLVRMRTWIDGHGGRFGWAWGEAPSEWWHVTYYGHGFGRPDPGPDVANPRLSHGSGGPCQAYPVDEARRRLGLPTGRPFTVQMVAAVQKFQRAHGLPADGVVGGRTWTALRGQTRAVANPAVLRLHSPPYSGQDVAAWQGLINARLKDVRNPNLIHVDGVFGASTAARLRYLQKYWWRIPVTGMTTATTRAKLKVSLVRTPPAKTTTGAENTKPPPTAQVPHPVVVHRGPMYGADVSEHNESINWREARKRVEFVIIRATWAGTTKGGLHVDSYLSNERCQQARNAGLKIGFYHFDVPTTLHSPEAAADYFTGAVWRFPACRWRVGDLLAAHDQEATLLSSSANSTWDNRWRRRVQRNIYNGIRRNLPVIEYGGSHVRELQPPVQGQQSPLWLPGYGNDDGRGLNTYWQGYFTPPAWRYKGWWIAIYQYWSRGRWTASGGDVDFNIVQNADYWLPKLLVR